MTDFAEIIEKATTYMDFMMLPGELIGNIRVLLGAISAGRAAVFAGRFLPSWAILRLR
ncbi:MAG: hypothetical protein ACXIVE_00710 [Salinarimonas sp.]